MKKAIYRVYRPQNFADVVGQGHVIKTLQNQIQNDSIAHAYLFCGTRGTGKTSTAKIFARAVNCTNPNEENEPCNECDVCKGILTESLMDVVEIDAASNNGVDDIRELRESVKYPPSKGKYKVYIIDEVHMLSIGAFNALLKTLEEPPSYVIFILATTEMHKLPATILSRCQRFDFKRVSVEDMIERMKFICQSMDVDVDSKSLDLIARNAGGALRDALSILDKCVSFSSGTIRYEDTVNLLGIVGNEFLFKISEAISKNDTKESLKHINEIVVWGKDIKNFLESLINHFRNLMLSKLSADLQSILNITVEDIEKLNAEAESMSMNEIIRTINILSECESEMKYSSHPRILLEVAVMKLSQPSFDDSTEGLLSRIESLEKMMANPNARVVVTQNMEGQAVQAAQPSSQPVQAPAANVKKRSIKTDDREILEDILNKWAEVMGQMKKDKKMQVQALIREGKIHTLENKLLYIKFPKEASFHREALSKDINKDYIKDVIKRVCGYELNLLLIMESEVMGEEIVDENSDQAVDLLKKMFPSDLIEIRD